MKVKALIITGFGLNCEKETSKAFEYVGAEPEQVHLNDLIDGKKELKDYHILAFIGGFSFGDHLGAGTVFANKIKYNLKDQLQQFIDDGKLIIGICNGFQTITRLGLVPARNGHYFTQEVALTNNDSNNFIDDWVYLKTNPTTNCVFTKGLDVIRLPIRHGEGKFVADPILVEDIFDQIVFFYGNKEGWIMDFHPENPNGSVSAIAGICDPTGRIFGLMPHPEAFLSPLNAPDWQDKKLKGELPKEGEGVIIFRNAVDFAKENLINI